MRLTQRQAAKELAELVLDAYGGSSERGSAFPHVEKVAIKLAKQVVPRYQRDVFGTPRRLRRLQK